MARKCKARSDVSHAGTASPGTGVGAIAPTGEEPAMELQPVESSLIHSVGYDPASSVLEIRFLESQRIYEFFNVPFSVYDELMAAESKGQYFNEMIRDFYVSQEVHAANLETSDWPVRS
jgi:hypothetical protein